MSELSVYSSADHVDPDQLIERLAADWQVRFLKKDGILKQVRIEDAEIAVGLPLSGAQFDVTDTAAFQTRYSANEVAAVSVFADPVTGAARSSLKKMIRVAPAGFRERLKGTRIIYTLTTNAARNKLSAIFLRDLWQALGVATGGILFDGDEDEFSLSDG